MSTSRNPRHRKPGSATAVRTMAVRAATIGAVAMPGAAVLGAHEQARPAQPTSALARPLLEPEQTQQEQTQERADVAEVEHKLSATPVAEPAKTVQAKTPAAAVEYTVHEGDTLSRIAERTLGSASKYHEIFALNKDREEPDGERFTDPSLIKPGWTLTLPAAAKAEQTHTARTTQTTRTAMQTTQTAQAGQTARTTQTTHVSRTSSAAKPASTQHTHTFTVSTSTKSTGTLKDWINEAIVILKASGYDVSYDAVYETAMHESAGNPDAVNESDSNAAEGHPSIGLMQTIQSTFDAYALPGHRDIYNPVDNIIAAARYAAAVYGSLDEMVEARCDGSCWRGY